MSCRAFSGLKLRRRQYSANMNEFLERLTDEYVDELLEKLNYEAENVDSYEYGLPLHDVYMERLRLAVRQWAHKNNLAKDKNS